jgi:hypothetical protein
LLPEPVELAREAMADVQKDHAEAPVPTGNG